MAVGPSLLLDREAEVAVLARAVRETAGGRGGVVVVEGDAGVGKSRLLAEARGLAGATGMSVLTACGSELESDYAYGLVRQLFEAAVAGADGETWLADRAAAAAPVFATAAAPADAAAPYAILNGLYWLVVGAVERRGPLTLVVDDLHWADPPSAAFLGYLARRLEDLAILLVLATRGRDAEFSADPATTVIAPRSLSVQAAARLVGDQLDGQPSARFAAGCHQATGGNPLLLVELLRGLRGEGVDPDDAHVGAIENVGPAAVRRIVLLRLRRLTTDAVAVAEALAVLGPSTTVAYVAALAGCDEASARVALDALSQASVVDPRQPLSLAHPIIRETIYHELTPVEREHRHLRAAELIASAGGPAEQVGAHLLLTPGRGRPWVIDALRTAAADAGRRGAVQGVTRFLRRALDERPGDARADLLIELGTAEAAVDAPAAAVHLGRARAAATDPRERARIGQLVTRMLVFTHPRDAVAAARAARAELPDELADDAAAFAAIERYAGWFEREDGPPDPDGHGDGPGARTLLAVGAWERALHGDPAAAELARTALRDDASLFVRMVATTALLLADDPQALALWDEVVATAQPAGHTHALIAAGVWRGWIFQRRGELEDAEAALRTVLAGPGTWGEGAGSIPPHAPSLLVGVLIDRGDLTAARELLQPAARATGEGAMLMRSAELKLLVAERRFADALAVEVPTGVRNPAWAPWRSLRAEALHAVGRREEAAAAAHEELVLARRWGTPGPIARALLALARVEGTGDRIEEAVAVTAHTSAQLEHATALGALGGWLRRDGRPADARTPLRDAHALAVRCGAHGLAGQVRGELATAGGRPRAVRASGPASLTPSERRVADLAAAGRRNREIAQELFLSLKTVEVHLSSTYRKLDIRSRAELAAAIG